MKRHPEMIVQYLSSAVLPQEELKKEIFWVIYAQFI